VTDVAILTLPIRQVWRLQMSTSRKFSVLGMFALGSIVCVFGIIRCTAVGKANILDPTWTNVEGGIWSEVEMAVGIVCACLPTYGPFLTTVFGGGTPRPTYGSSRQTGSSYAKGSRAVIPSVPLADRDPSGAWTRMEADESGDEKPFVQTHIAQNQSQDPRHGGIRVQREVHQY
jgi:hypothetical protein